MIGVFIKGDFGHRREHGENKFLRMMAEIREMQVKEHQRLPANNQKLGKRHGTDFFSEPSEKINPADFTQQNSDTFVV